MLCFKLTSFFCTLIFYVFELIKVCVSNFKCKLLTSSSLSADHRERSF